MSNTVTAYFKGRVGVAEALYQNDYGIVMAFDGIDLPAHFDCYFTAPGSDTAIPGVGADNRVAIPNAVLANSGNVVTHIPLHTGDSDSEVEYIVYFKVIGRARPEDDGTPVQMTAIERALALLQEPIGNIEEIVNEALSFTGTSFNDINNKLDNLIANSTPSQVTQLWSGTLTKEGDVATLSQSIADFDFVDVYVEYYDSDYLRKPVANGSAYFAIQSQNLDDNGANNYLQLWEKGLQLSGTTATVVKNVSFRWDDFSAPPVVTPNAQTGTNIIRIDGIKLVSDTIPELNDVRYGADGVTYNNAGNAVRAQITDLKSNFNTRLYGGDYSGVTWVDGFIYLDAVSTNTGWQRTLPFFMKKGEVLTYTGGKGDTLIHVNAVSKYENGVYSLAKSYDGTGLEDISFTAPSDMYAVVSVKKDLYSNDLVIERNGDIVEIENRLDEIPSYVYNNISATELSISAGGYVQFDIAEGETYLVENKGTNNLSLSTRVSPGSVTTDTIVVPTNSIVEFTATGNASYIVSAVDALIAISTKTTLLPFINRTSNALGNYGLNVPLVHFTFSKDMFDFSTELNGVDFMDNTGQGGWYLIPETVTAKFDSLVSAYPSYVSKVDAGADAELTYPAYANLNGVASGNYRATPTYRTYMYKFETNDVYVNGALNKKKKLLLIGATHGSETAGSFNLYLFAKNLCECANEDYFKLRSAYDIYIIPCLNGYGMYHLTRWNADGVNINRNYPISNFEVSGEPYEDDYTGPSAGSEFETQIVVKLQEKYGFDVAIDHHNYGASSNQFYTESWHERFRPLSNSALVDCAYSFIKNKPAHFGSNYQLFVNIANSTMPNVVLSNTMPCMAKWFFEQQIDYSATIEISNTINFVNGALSPSADNPKYTADVFAVGEFTLRNQLLHYCGFVLGGTGN